MSGRAAWHRYRYRPHCGRRRCGCPTPASRDACKAHPAAPEWQTGSDGCGTTERGDAQSRQLGRTTFFATVVWANRVRRVPRLALQAGHADERRPQAVHIMGDSVTNALTLYSSQPLSMPPRETRFVFTLLTVWGNQLPVAPRHRGDISAGECWMASLAGSGVGRLHCSTCAAGLSRRNKYPRCSIRIRWIPNYAGRICEGSTNLRTDTLHQRRSIGERPLGISAAGVWESPLRSS